MTQSLWPILLALPWLLGPPLVLLRALQSRFLRDEPAEPPADPPLVSAIVPARNEARNIERCLRALLATSYPALEIVVVDDHSDDGTGAIARGLAHDDQRVRVIENPALPAGWFGKPWACTTGAASARGTILYFADADTAPAPDLVPRAVNAMRARDADLLSVGGTQEMGSFWERVVQPQVFFMLLARFGGTERVNRSRSPRDKIANGQCIFTRRDAYDAVGGHAAVRGEVAEDLMLAQRYFEAGRRVALVLGPEQLSTRMYTSLRELVEGWSKNVYAGGRRAMPGGRIGQLLFPAALVLGPLSMVAPPLALAGVALTGGVGSTPLGVWAAIATAASLLWWGLVYLGARVNPLYAFTYPLGAAVLLYIMVRAIARGERVAWKGREYGSA